MEASDTRGVADLIAALGDFRLGQAPALDQVSGQLGTLLRAELVVYYTARVTLGGVELGRIGGASDNPVHRLGGRQVRSFSEHFPDSWPGFNPIRVAPELQNSVTTLRQPRVRNPLARHDAFFEQIAPSVGLAGFDQIRALACDGPSLLYWIGAMRRERFSSREIGLFRELLPSVQRRLLLERAIDGVPSLTMLAGILDGFGTAAFLIGPTGAVEACNALGLQVWTQDRWGLREELDLSRRAPGPRTPLAITTLGGEGYVLAVQRRRAVSTAARADLAARRWSLTPRQREVLALVVDGQTNWQIASRLECAERTVEVHMTAILQRAQLANRATLIATVLTFDA